MQVCVFLFTPFRNRMTYVIERKGRSYFSQRGKEPLRISAFDTREVFLIRVKEAIYLIRMAEIDWKTAERVGRKEEVVLKSFYQSEKERGEIVGALAECREGRKDGIGIDPKTDSRWGLAISLSAPTKGLFARIRRKRVQDQRKK